MLSASAIEDNKEDIISLISKFDDSDVTTCICDGVNPECGSSCVCCMPVRRLFLYMKDVFDPCAKTTSLENMYQVFRMEYIFKELFLEKKDTLLDIFELGLKGNDQEIMSLVDMSTCLAITLGAKGKFILRKLKLHLLKWLTDFSKPTLLRTKCVAALGFLGFLTSNDKTEVKSFMEAFYGVFCRTSVEVEEVQFHVQALKFWSLLAIKYFSNLNVIHIQKIIELLKSSNLELKKAAGESIAGLYESNRKGHKKNMSPTKLKEYATKYQDLEAIENIKAPDYIKTAHGIKLNINSWSRKCQYDALTYILGSGMKNHLDHNPLLRSIFGLGTTLKSKEELIKKIGGGLLRGIHLSEYVGKIREEAKHQNSVLNEERRTGYEIKI